MIEDTTHDMLKIIKTREELTKRIANALSHLPADYQVSAICGWIPISDLEVIANLHEGTK